MPKTSFLRTLSLCLAAFAAGPGGAQQMTARLAEPAVVPLDFLQWTGKEPSWLMGELDRQGLANRVMLREATLETADLDALKAVNRIRSFAFLAAKGLRPPVFDLPLTDGGRCVTQFARQVVPGIGPDDFDRPAFDAARGDPEVVQDCRTDGRGGFGGLDRQAFAARYFDASGVLKPEFREVSNDPDFRAAAIDLGFFLTIEDFSGLLRIDER